jgi:hypothetical protein
MEEQILRKVEAAWPQDGLELVEACPVCGSRLRELLHEGLRDRIFFCAPGEWNLYRCGGCGSGYLDPRPTRETIHLAYRNYFTHATGDGCQPSPRQPFARVFANGFRNWRFGTKDQPSSRLGVLVKALQPGRRAQIDAEMRNLPQPWPGATLLDIGCGNGKFLMRARDMGWHVLGVDPDPLAVEVARARGLDVLLGGVDVLASSEVSLIGSPRATSSNTCMIPSLYSERVMDCCERGGKSGSRRRTWAALVTRSMAKTGGVWNHRVIWCCSHILHSGGL